MTIRTVGELFADDGQKPPPAKRFTFWTVEELLALPPQEFLVDDMLVAETVGELFGKPGSLKTFVALGIGLCVAAGLPWQGREVKQGPVIFMAGEGERGLQKRVHAWKIRNPAASTQQFRIMGGIVRALMEHDLTDFLRDMPVVPSLVILDTLSRSLAGGDENSSRDMGAFVDLTERLKVETGATVLVLHHSDKGGNYSRGHSSFLGAVQTEIEAQATDDLRVELTCRKQKDHSPFEPIALQGRVVELSDGTTSLVLEPGRPKPKELTQAQQTSLAVLAGSMRQSEWLKAAEAAGVKRATFNRARSHLVKEGFVRQFGETYEKVS